MATFQYSISTRVNEVSGLLFKTTVAGNGVLDVELRVRYYNSIETVLECYHGAEAIADALHDVRNMFLDGMGLNVEEYWQARRELSAYCRGLYDAGIVVCWY